MELTISQKEEKIETLENTLNVTEVFSALKFLIVILQKIKNDLTDELQNRKDELTAYTEANNELRKSIYNTKLELQDLDENLQNVKSLNNDLLIENNSLKSDINNHLESLKELKIHHEENEKELHDALSKSLALLKKVQECTENRCVYSVILTAIVYRKNCNIHEEIFMQLSKVYLTF